MHSIYILSALALKYESFFKYKNMHFKNILLLDHVCFFFVVFKTEF